jgi:integrase
MPRIDTKRGREALGIRREPYWYKLARDRHLGLRKLTEGSPGAWIARFRDESGGRRYQALGECTELFDFDEAKVAAETWFRDLEQGVQARGEDGQPATVALACMAYVRALRAEGRVDAAHDAHMRFRRTVYGSVADAEFGPKGRMSLQQADSSPPPAPAQPGKPTKRRKWEAEPHELANLPISKLYAPRLKAWHLDLVAAGLSKAAANRTLTALKAALNKAVADRRVSPVAAQEWAAVAPLKGAAQRRDLFLDLTQRRALLAHATGGVRDLIEAAICTGCRAGELTSARRSAFDARTGTLAVTGKTGSRTIPLALPAITLFQRLSRDKLPGAFLFVRDDGKPWSHSDWDELVKRAAAAAELPAKTCLYTLRHSFITQALLDGVSTLEVAKLVGTSLPMIEKHYGHLVFDRARERLAKVQIV